MPPSGRRSPLLTSSTTDLRTAESTIVFDPRPLPPTTSHMKRWYHYIPLCGTVALILGPHPSLLYVLVDFHLLTRRQPFVFLTHLLVTYTLTFLALSSLIVCVVRDPGPPNAPSRLEGAEQVGEEMGLTEALMSGHDYSSPGKWCRKCWAPKPERAHHCSICNRCVLKMDHHCPWLGAKCIGHRTYPAFLHFLCSVSLLSIYVAVVAIHALFYAFQHPFEIIHEMIPVHEIGLAFIGLVFALVIGSFAGYHFYLITINQTTLENITPYVLLRHLPPLPRSGHSLSNPPLEPELNSAQRRLVKHAHAQISLYDVGWRKNWAQVYGWKGKYGLLVRLWYGGASAGDGKHFPRNPRSEEMLANLAQELVKADINS